MGRFSALRLHPPPIWRGGIVRLFSLVFAHFPVGRGGPARLFGLAIAHWPRCSRQWEGRAPQSFDLEGPRQSALQPRPRPLASGEGGASPSPTLQWGGEALLGFSASPSPADRAARASGEGERRSSTLRPHSRPLGGVTPLGTSTSPSPTHRWGREGGASQAFSLAQALARLARRRRLALQPCPYPLANGAERRFSAAAALQPRSRRLALRPLPRPLIMSGRGITRLINFALAHLPV